MADLGDGQAVNIVAAPGKQADDAGENARLIVDLLVMGVALGGLFDGWLGAL